MAVPLLSALPPKLKRLRNHHLPRYVFIHINKTAGSSIEEALDLRFEHKTAVEKRRELGEFRWRRAFKFAFVRNPWDRVVSHYHYRVKTNQTGLGDGHLSFRDWVIAVYRDRDCRYLDQPMMFQPQWAWISDVEGRLMLDFVGRFESLESDLREVSKRVAQPIRLPHLKRSERVNYTGYYDDETRRLVAEAFHVDIVKFGYEFGSGR